MRVLPSLAIVATLSLLMPAEGRAASYSIQSVATFGGMIGTVMIKTGVDGAFEIGTLNNSAQISFVTENTAGGEVLCLYANGTVTPLIVGGGAAPGGQWPTDVGILSPVSMNQNGNLAFAADVTVGGFTGLGTFFWDSAAQSFSPVVLLGNPTVFKFNFERGANWLTAINDSNEIAFSAMVQNAAGMNLSGDFFRGQDGQTVLIAGPDDTLGDGSQIIDACSPSLNDAGVVAFSARRKIDLDYTNSCYQWEQGVTSPVARVGTSLPGGIRLANVVGNWVNNQNRKVLLAVQTGPSVIPDTVERPTSLYLWDNGTFTPVAVPGQTMPDGSKLVSVQDFGVSYGNDLGQHAFLAILQGGATAAYLMNPDGTLSLIAKSGMSTNLGTLRNVGQGAGTSSGIGLNKSGQVAFTALIGSGVDTIVLLTPTGQ